MKTLITNFILIFSLLVFSGCDTAKEIWDALPDFTAEQDGKTVAGKDCVVGTSCTTLSRKTGKVSRP